MLNEIWEAAAPSVVELTASILMLVLTWASFKARQLFGLNIEARHREALHSAVMSGVRAALEGNLTGADAAQMAVDYARSSVPDAIKYLGAQDGVLMRLAEAKMQNAFGLLLPELDEAA